MNWRKQTVTIGAAEKDVRDIVRGIKRERDRLLREYVGRYYDLPEEEPKPDLAVDAAESRP